MEYHCPFEIGDQVVWSPQALEEGLMHVQHIGPGPFEVVDISKGSTRVIKGCVRLNAPDDVGGGWVIPRWLKKNEENSDETAHDTDRNQPR